MLQIISIPTQPGYNRQAVRMDFLFFCPPATTIDENARHRSSSLNVKLMITSSLVVNVYLVVGLRLVGLRNFIGVKCYIFIFLKYFI